MEKEDRKNYGFIPDKIQPEDYVFGGIGIPTEPVLQPDGQWDVFLPEGEMQAKNGVETFACTAFGTTSAIEILMKRKYGQ